MHRTFEVPWWLHSPGYLYAGSCLALSKEVLINYSSGMASLQQEFIYKMYATVGPDG